MLLGLWLLAHSSGHRRQRTTGKTGNLSLFTVQLEAIEKPSASQRGAGRVLKLIAQPDRVISLRKGPETQALSDTLLWIVLQCTCIPDRITLHHTTDRITLIDQCGSCYVVCPCPCQPVASNVVFAGWQARSRLPRFPARPTSLWRPFCLV